MVATQTREKDKAQFQEKLETNLRQKIYKEDMTLPETFQEKSGDLQTNLQLMSSRSEMNLSNGKELSRKAGSSKQNTSNEKS